MFGLITASHASVVEVDLDLRLSSVKYLIYNCVIVSVGLSVRMAFAVFFVRCFSSFSVTCAADNFKSSIIIYNY